jgi:hypothetical protein
MSERCCWRVPREEEEEEDEANVVEPEELPLARQMNLKLGDMFMLKRGILALLSALGIVETQTIDHSQKLPTLKIYAAPTVQL